MSLNMKIISVVVVVAFLAVSSEALRCYGPNDAVTECPNLEDSVCMKVVIGESYTKSCSVEQACAAIDQAKKALESTSSFLEKSLGAFATTKTEIFCCTGDLCNAAGSTSPGLIAVFLTLFMCYVAL